MPTTEHGLFVAAVRALVDWHRRDDEVFTLIDSLGMTAIDYRHDGRTWSVSVDRWSSQVNDAVMALHAEVSSVQEAVDYLVTAGVLPAEFHSIHASYVRAHDAADDAIGLDSNGWVDWLGPCLVDVPGFEPLFRCVTEPAESVTP